MVVGRGVRLRPRSPAAVPARAGPRRGPAPGVVVLVATVGLVVAACAPTARLAATTRATVVAAAPEGTPGAATPTAGPSPSTGTPQPAGGSPSGLIGGPGPTMPQAGGSPTGGPSPVGGPEAADGPAGPPPVIRLGTVLPLQGGERDFGEPLLRTTQAYIDEINAAGGIAALGGATYELVAYHACLVCQDEALQAARRLVEADGVFALVNTVPMVVAFQSVIPYLVDRGVPLIQGGAENQVSDALSPVNFATSPPGAFYGKLIPAMAGEHSGMTRVGIVYLDVPSEANGIPTLRRELERAGMTVVRTEAVEAAEEAVTNMDGVVTRMRAAGADGIVATNPVLLIFGRLAADRQRYGVPWVGPAAWSALVEEACGRICDDVVLTDSGGLAWVGADTPQMRQYDEVLTRRYPGAERTGHTLAAWVGMQVVTEALTRAGAIDRAAFLAALEGFRDVDLGTTSPLTFTPDRHLGGSATVLLRLSDGRFTPVGGFVSYGEVSP